MNQVTIGIGRALLCLMVVAAAPNLAAFDLGQVEIHGFVTMTGTKTTDNNLFTLDTADGDLGWFEAGINFNIEPVDNLRIGMQLYSRTLGAQGDGDVVIDWATGDYRVRDWFGIRVGKNKMPTGLYNTARDADMTRTAILLPQSIYTENLRDLVNAYIGGEIYGTIPLGGASDLEYQVYYGTQNLDDTHVIRRNIETGVVASLAFLPLPLDELTYNIDSIDADMDHMMGFALRWRTPVDGLLFSVTGQTSEATFTSRTVYNGWMAQGPASVPVSFALTTESDYELVSGWSVSGEYRRNRLVVAAEYWAQETEISSVLTGLPFPMPTMPPVVGEPVGYYGQVAYRFTDWFELGTYYSIYYSDKNDKDGNRFLARGQSAAQAWSKDLAISARFDINRHMLFKLEGHFVDGSGLISPLDNHQTIEDDYTMVLGRFTFYF